MEFHVTLIEPVANLAVIEDAILACDPAAQIDVDKLGQTLRVAAFVEAAELVSLLDQAGYPVDASQVVELPAICCGGCGG